MILYLGDIPVRSPLWDLPCVGSIKEDLDTFLPNTTSSSSSPDLADLPLPTPTVGLLLAVAVIFNSWLESHHRSAWALSLHGLLDWSCQHFGSQVPLSHGPAVGLESED